MSSEASSYELTSPTGHSSENNDHPKVRTEKMTSRFQTYKNLLVISIAFFLQFTAFGAMENLQSSLNTEANIGVNSLAIINGCLIFSSLLLPHPLIALLGLKWTMVISQIP